MDSTKFHKQLLYQIKAKSGKPKKQIFLDNYLGNSHLKYPINNPTLRTITKEFTKAHKDLSVTDFRNLLTQRSKLLL